MNFPGTDFSAPERDSNLSALVISFLLSFLLFLPVPSERGCKGNNNSLTRNNTTTKKTHFFTTFSQHPEYEREMRTTFLTRFPLTWQTPDI